MGGLRGRGPRGCIGKVCVCEGVLRECIERVCVEWVY